MADESSAPHSDPDLDASIFEPRKLTQLLVLIAVGIACFLFWIVGRWLRIPFEPRFQPSLIQSPNGPVAFIAEIILIAVSWVIGDWIAGGRWRPAGLFAATVGLSVWSVRGGTMQYLLFHAQNAGTGRAVFPHLLAELVVLFVPIVAIWNWLFLRSIPRQKVGDKKTATETEASRSTATAIIAQVGVTILLLYILLVETPAKKQVLVGMFIACLAGTAVAQSFFANSRSWRWYWIGPLVAGAAGYIVAAFIPDGIQIGHLSGGLAPLARAVPLDYASFGCAGALLGYRLGIGDVEAAGEQHAEDQPPKTTP